MPSKLLTGAHPDKGKMLWTAVDPTVHHIVGMVAESRFSARLAPFKSQGEALAALKAAGCIGV